MKLNVKYITFLFCLSFWPISLFLANTTIDFLRYFVPIIIVFICFLLFSNNWRLFLAPLIIIPFIEPKMAIFPFVTILLFILWSKEKRYRLFLCFSLLVLAFNWKAFWGQTIFRPDYQKQQEIIGKSYLYPSVFTARLFQNKPRTYINKFSNNFFAITDPNNYFFGFAPGQIIIDNQNLVKFPSLSLSFLLVGLYFIGQNKHKKIILAFFIAAILNLSILTNFDRNDFILWIPMFLVIFSGLDIFDRKFKYARHYYLIFILVTCIELIRIFIK